MSAVASDSLRSIETDTAQATGRMRELLLKAWLRALVVGLSLFLGFSGGSWATMHWLSRSIQARMERVAELDYDIYDARQTLAHLGVDTWGVALLEIEGERVVVLQTGTLDNPGWAWRERPAVKLSRE